MVSFEFKFFCVCLSVSRCSLKMSCFVNLCASIGKRDVCPARCESEESEESEEWCELIFPARVE